MQSLPFRTHNPTHLGDAPTDYFLPHNRGVLSKSAPFMSQGPPQILRIKRKRGEDPLQALILEGRQSVKRSKLTTPLASGVSSPSNESQSWYFHLDKTEDISQNLTVTQSLLTESRRSDENSKHFVIPKKHVLEDSMIPHELTDMLENFLSLNTPTSRKKRKGGQLVSSGSYSGSKQNEVSEQDMSENEKMDYVFDTYKLSEVEPLTEANYPKSQIGYIRFFEDEEYELMQSDDDVDLGLSDDEDSNAESFYQNDYPEDEDAGAFSDSYAYAETDEEPESELTSPQKGEADASTEADEFDNLYNDLLGRTTDLVDDEPYERQHFFQDECDDELAKHRDRVFSRLQTMIEES